MKIESINIKNFKGIDSFKGEINGRNVYLIGGNGTGKTSFIDAVWFGLTGKNCPPEPTKDGAKKGLIELDLGDYIARTKLTKGKPTVFEIENKNATKETDKFVKSPRSFMESKIGILNFSIDEFFNKSDAEQLKYFAKIMDEDFTDIDSEIEENVESRKFDKKKLKSLIDAQEFYDIKDAEKELVDVVELSKKIAAAKTKQETFTNVETGVADRIKKVDEINKEIAALILERDGGTSTDGTITIVGLSKEISGGKAWLLDADNVPLTDEESQDLTASLETVTEDNEKITTAKKGKIEDEKIETLETCINENNDNLEQLKSDKATRISDLIGVEGLTYDIAGERFLYEGLPFDKTQINTAAQLIAGMKIGASTLKDLKILKVDASLIDKDNFEEVLAWAESEKIELFIELVNRESGKLEIHIDADN